MDRQHTAFRFIKLHSLPILEVTTAFLLVIGVLAMAITSIADVVYFSDVGYPDSATLLRVQELLSTGQIYPDFDIPPYLVTLYGPLCYVLLGSLYKIAQWLALDPRTIIRLGIIATLLLCALTIFRISQRLYLERGFAFLSLLFATSIAPLASYAITIRGDLPALALSLSSFYLYLGALNSRKRLVAAICAGLALLVKQTFLAVPCAILIWHFWRREFREGFLWVSVVLGTVFLGYAVAYLREPAIVRHFAALGSPIFEFPGALQLMGEAFLQPQTLFGMFGVFLAIHEGDSRKLLFSCYWFASWLIAALTIVQIGGDRNYFWEPLLVSAIGAGHGLVCFVRNVNRGPAFLKILAALVLFGVFFPALKTELFQITVSYSSLKTHDHARSEWELFLSRIRGRRILSTFADITIESRVPEVPDPFLNNVLAQRGKWDVTPILREIRSSTYDLVIVRSDLAAGASFHRGLGIWSPSIWQALKRNYVRACVLWNLEVWVPRDTDSAHLLEALSTTRCKFASSTSSIPNHASVEFPIAVAF
jgi:hypothetical protein